VVPKGGAIGPVAEGHAGFLGNIGEGTVVVIVVETVLAIVSYEQIEPSIVVIVADRHTETPALISDARFGGDIGEGAVVIVMKQGRARVWCVSFESFIGGAIHQVDVQQAVVVVIDGGRLPSRSPR